MAMQAKMESKSIPQERLASLDVLRGFDMFWIVGGGSLLGAILNYLGCPCFEPFKKQLEHTDWIGFTAWDLIFPLFIFISGVTIPFSFEKYLSSHQKGSLYLKVIKRAVILIVLGFIYNGLLKTFDFAHTRYLSVLGLIGFSYLWASIIVINFRPRNQFILGIVILFAYYLCMTCIPVPGFGPGVLTKEGNFASYIDRLIVPGKLAFGVSDPEGILMTFPASVLAIAGALTGALLRKNIKDYFKFLIISGAGTICLLVGLFFGIHFPIIKKLWTSSFVIYTIGWSLLLTALFYLIVDIWKIKKIFFPFLLIGLNPITIYLCAHKIINFQYMSEFFFGGLITISGETLKPVILWFGILICEFIFLYILYRKKIFLKV
jgi:predicted acyltransferase